VQHRAQIVRVTIGKGKAGLFYATSPDLHGLLVAKRTVDALFEAVPDAIAELVEAASGERVIVLLAARGDDPMVHPFVAVPSDAIRRALATMVS
jgi:hypothetical protein